ncbi:type VI secretion system baseplate subunit TssG [Paraglaciecola sp.]|uniref:type VI secretion system baseplate subunit TssG n=1 Tax=Paraglaciecola sp. TaxID=1920173 RepID=UPI003EFA67CB
MAAQNEPAAYPVIEDLQKYPQRFSFYQAIRLMEVYVHGERVAEDKIGIGFNGPINLEAVRVRPHASLGFSAADIKKITMLESEDSIKFQMEVTFMGLYGTVSPLPAFYTEDIIMDSDGESNRRDFLDLFHHRAISLHYRTLDKYQLFNHLKPELDDHVSNWLFSLMGLRGVMSLDQLPLKRPHRLLANLGLLTMRSRSGAMMSHMISHYFGQIPVRVEEFIERQVNITEEQHVFLGKQQSTLGMDMTIGSKLNERAGKFRVWLGPLSFERFNAFLPTEDDFEELVTLIKFLLQDPLSFDIGLILQEQDIHLLGLKKASTNKLGWSSWLGRPPAGNKHIIIGRNIT